MFLKQLDLTTALRPSYLPDEDLLFVQDNVGLYEGKYKLQNQQNGQVYLTSHRICYVDKVDPRKYSASLDLRDVDKYEFYAGFLKSSPKITLVPKLSKRTSLQARATGHAGSPQRSNTASPHQQQRPPAVSPVANATWVCQICSFSNPVPSNFDPESLNAHTPMPPCLACGIPPTLTHVLKAVIASAANRPQVDNCGPLPLRSRQDEMQAKSAGRSESQSPGAPSIPAALAQAQSVMPLHKPPDSTPSSSSTPGVAAPTAVKPDASFQCPRCTFLNHPSLLACEMCGAPLVSRGLPAELTQAQLLRTESPGPVISASFGTQAGSENPESVKISFRGGGGPIFYERLKGSITQRKWLLQNAPPIPSLSRGGSGSMPSSSSGAESTPPRVKAAGIAGLEKRSLSMRKNNELVIGSAFEDLEALMASAKQIVALAERLAQQTGGGGSGANGSTDILAQSASELGLVTTKDIVGGGGASGQSLYLSELARNLAEFLTDDARGVLRKAGGIISLVDLWAVFNRARGGVELVSPMDLLKAAKLWEKLRLPVRLRTFKSGVLVVQSRDRTDEATVKALVGWLRDLHAVPGAGPGMGVGTPSGTSPSHEIAPWDWQEFGRGVSAQEVAERFGWSIGVAEEELEMAEERGVLCREEGIAGLRFWENYIDTGEYRSSSSGNGSGELSEEKKILKNLRDSGFL